MTTLLDYPAALAAAKSGSKIARLEWNGQNMFVRYTDPAQHPNVPELTLSTRSRITPWTPTQADLDATDWFVLVI